MKISVIGWLEKILSTKISLPVYVFCGSNILLALGLMLSAFSGESTAFSRNLPIDFTIWTSLLFVSGVGATIGFRYRKILGPFALISFMCWMFANWSLVLTGNWLSITLTIPYTALFAYIYLANSIDVLDRISIKQAKKLAVFAAAHAREIAVESQPVIQSDSE